MFGRDCPVKNKLNISGIQQETCFLLAQSAYSPRFIRNWAKAHIPKSPNYYQQNQSKVSKVLQNLADSTSQKIFSELISCRINNKKYPLSCPGTQYFPQDILKLNSQEIFVDCGAYTGDTILNFRRFCNNHYKHIVAFEPEPTLFAKLKHHHFPSCTYIHGGVWKNKDFLSFLATASAGSRLELADTSGNCPQSQLIKIPVYKIDEISSCWEMTFLKMDVEGAELEALKGAEKASAAIGLS